jgi:hypothetical protein
MDNVKKFQWSGMYGGKQYVIRTDDETEFDNLVKKYELIIDDKVTPPMNTHEEKLQNFAKDYEASQNLCPEHQIPMLEGFSKKTNKPYKYHDTNGMRCFGKGYMPPIK